MLISALAVSAETANIDIKVPESSTVVARATVNYNPDNSKVTKVTVKSVSPLTQSFESVSLDFIIKSKTNLIIETLSLSTSSSSISNKLNLDSGKKKAIIEFEEPLKYKGEVLGAFEFAAVNIVYKSNVVIVSDKSVEFIYNSDWYKASEAIDVTGLWFPADEDNKVRFWKDTDTQTYPAPKAIWKGPFSDAVTKELQNRRLPRIGDTALFRKKLVTNNGLTLKSADVEVNADNGFSIKVGAVPDLLNDFNAIEGFSSENKTLQDLQNEISYTQWKDGQVEKRIERGGVAPAINTSGNDNYIYFTVVNEHYKVNHGKIGTTNNNPAAIIFRITNVISDVSGAVGSGF
jgi:hypothetical protein